MQGPFLTYCLVSLCILLFLRVFILEFVNITHSIALPTFLVVLFWLFREGNRRLANLNVWLLAVLSPLVVLIVAQKTISQSPAVYHLNESFLSWLVLLIYLSLISPLEWRKVVALSVGSLVLFTGRLWLHYGASGIRDDLYIHFLSAVMIIGIIVRAKEALDRL
jgi:hypothetical protein